MKLVQVFSAIAFLLVLTTCMAWSQAQVTVPVKVVLATDSGTVYFGYDKTATYCLDASLLEVKDPTFPGVFDARFIDPRGFNDLCMGIGIQYDFRTWLTSAQNDTFEMSFEGTQSPSLQWKVSWPAGLSSQFSSLILKDAIVGVFEHDMLSVTSANLANNIRQWFIYATPIVNAVRLDNNGIPGEFALNQNYPNPFNPSTTVSFGIKNAVFADIVVYDVLGRKVKTLASEQLAPGTYSTQWNGLDEQGNAAGSGVYFVRMSARTTESSNQSVFSAVRKLMLMK